jgi:YbbR domain-containing protein
MDKEKITGYDDQELLLRALVTFVSKEIHRSEQIVKGMIRQCITEWIQDNDTTLKDIRERDEKERFKIVSDIMDIFLGKITHVVESKSLRERLKQNALQIYEHWKKTKRVDSSGNVGSELEKFMSDD